MDMDTLFGHARRYGYAMFTSIMFAVLRTRCGISCSKRSSCIRLTGMETLTAPSLSSF